MTCAYFPVVLSFFLVFARVAAFTFTFNTPSECDDLGLNWSGGTPPFRLAIIPVFGTPREYDIPSSAFTNGKGSYSILLPVKKDQDVVFTMSDATGFNTGGSSSVFKVLESKGGTCNSTDSGIAFSFQLNSALQQCRPFIFSDYDGAVQPVTIAAIIPGGNGFLLNPSPGDPSYSWTVNVAHGTSMIFFMTDSRGREGGSSDVRVVGVSDDNTCLNNLSPSSTSNPPSPTQSNQPTTTTPTSPPSPTPPLSAAGIAGAIIGSVLFLSVVITLALFVMKRATSNKPKKRRVSQVDLNADVAPSSHMHPYGASSAGIQTANTITPFDSNQYFGNPALLPPQPYASDKYHASNSSLSGYYDPSISYAPSPTQYPPQPNYSIPSTPVDSLYASTAMSLPPTQPFDAQPSNFRPSSPNGSGTTSATKRKVPTAGGSQMPSRFIVHTDAEDALPPNEDGVVELPPQYSERRAPVRLEPPPPDSLLYLP